MSTVWLGVLGVAVVAAAVVALVVVRKRRSAKKKPNPGDIYPIW